MRTNVSAIYFLTFILLAGCGHRPPQYRASAIVRAVIGKTLQELPAEESDRIRKQHAITNALNAVRTVSGKELHEFLTADVALLRSLAAGVVTNKADSVSMGQYRHTDLIEINVVSDDPQNAVDLCNRLAVLYAESEERGLERQIVEKAAQPKVPRK